MALHLVAAALLASSRAFAAYIPDVPKSVPLLNILLGTEDQSNDAPGLAMTSTPNGVDQLKLSIGGEREIYVTWHTGLPKIVPASQGVPNPPDTASYAPEVSYGLHPDPTGKYERKVTDCEKTYYIQNYTGATALTTFQNPRTYYVSQIIVHCKLSNLLPKTKYFYRAGTPGAYSVEYAFTTPPATGPNFPVRIGVIADVGNTLNSSSTLQHLKDNKPDHFTIIGDLVYADRYTSAGVVNIINGVGNGIANSQSDQLNWDAFGHQLQTIADTAQIPLNVLAGNHEIERDDSNNIFLSIQTRYKSPYVQSKSTNPLYYSYNYGGVHIIMIHAYDGLIPNTPAAPGFANGGNYPQTSLTQAQIDWLTADLAAVDRTKTPWVLAQMHPPYYNTYVSHYKEIECLQLQIEDIIFNGGVDIFMFGHIHAYERHNRVYKYQINPCAPVHVTVGDGGNIEYGIRQFSDVCGGSGPTAPPVNPLPVDCRDAANATRLVGVPNTAPRFCTSFMPPYPGYPTGYYPNATRDGFFIQSRQPPYSAYRDPSFGHAIVEFKSSTEATISWYKNQLTDAVASDVTTVIRDPTCPNQKGGFSNPPPAVPNVIGQAAAAINGLVDGTTINNIVNHQPITG